MEGGGREGEREGGREEEEEGGRREGGREGRGRDREGERESLCIVEVWYKVNECTKYSAVCGM